jgi:dihydrofolate synthase/folylpolyglutamate synthase
MAAMALSYPEAVNWYYSFARLPQGPRLPDDIKLARMHKILAELGNPHAQFVSVLIAGTKGKGSTAALIASVLHAAGYRTGLYTSPHLHTFRERIRINGDMISKIHVAQGTALLQELAPQFPGSTFFEWVTALAFDALARQRVEIAVVEVGLGGRLDCTNVLTPRVTVITPVSFDHTEILGSTLDAIAREKAGIIKSTVPVVVAPQTELARRVIDEVAAAQDAPLVDVAQEWKVQLLGTTLDAQTVEAGRTDGTETQTLQLPLLGPHQRVNLATALATLYTLRGTGWKIPHGAIPRGISRVEWHARFEVLARSAPLPRPPGAPAGSETYMIADGAHNGASAHELVRTLDEVFPGTPVHFVFGASNDKDSRSMIEELQPRAASFVFTRSRHARAAVPDDLARLAAPYLVPIHTAPGLNDALMLAERLAAHGDVICITGSLFIAAEGRELVLRERGLAIEGD